MFVCVSAKCVEEQEKKTYLKKKLYEFVHLILIGLQPFEMYLGQEGFCYLVCILFDPVDLLTALPMIQVGTNYYYLHERNSLFSTAFHQ